MVLNFLFHTLVPLPFHLTCLKDLFFLKNILHVPDITKNLLSISQFTHDNNVVIEFYSTCCLVKDKNTRVTLLEGVLKDGLYQLDLAKALSRIKASSPSLHSPLFLSQCNKTSFSNSIELSVSQSVESCNNANVWHMRLGHPNAIVLSQILKSISSTQSSKIDFCTACKYGKMH